MSTDARAEPDLQVRLTQALSHLDRLLEPFAPVSLPAPVREELVLVRDLIFKEMIFRINREAPRPEEKPAPPAPRRGPPPPYLGRIVHYVLAESEPCAGEHRAAIIVGLPGGEEDPWLVNVRVFFDGTRGEERVAEVPYGAAGEPGAWHYPEKV